MTSSNIPRPSLDSVTVWRAQQIANQEHRSLANAVHVLVKEAWDARIAAMTAKVLPPGVSLEAPQ
jgi:hypothetical protein